MATGNKFINKYSDVVLAFVLIAIIGILMLIATVIFWLGRRQYVRVPPTRGEDPHSFFNVARTALTTQAAGQGRPGLLVMILSALSGVISMFVDNVVVILMMAPVALPLARALKLPVTPLVLMIGFAANFMGSAMLLGDLPPQMLHSVAGAEFGDFFWQHGRPSSFPILMVTFVITLAAM